jgi:hypothetical protein
MSKREKGNKGKKHVYKEAGESCWAGTKRERSRLAMLVEE